MIASTAAVDHAGTDRATHDTLELASRAIVAGLFLALAFRIVINFLETGRPTGLMVLPGELLIAVLTAFRRPAASVDRTVRSRLFTALSTLGPALILPQVAAGWFPEFVTLSLSCLGLSLGIAGKLALGRSFGLLPANRGIVCRGPYALVRHPIYAGYLLTHLAFLLAHPSVWNALVLAAADVALVIRIRYEERTLCQDRRYADYVKLVRWRLVPGLH